MEMPKSNYEFVDWLVRGSAEINRMKDEIQTIVSIVKAAGLSSINTGPNGLSIACDEKYRWAVYFSGDKLMIEFWHGSSGPRLYSSVDGKPSTHHVKDIHGRLGYLIGGLRQKAANFEYHISPYIFAAPLLPDVA